MSKSKTNDERKITALMQLVEDQQNKIDYLKNVINILGDEITQPPANEIDDDEGGSYHYDAKMGGCDYDQH